MASADHLLAPSDLQFNTYVHLVGGSAAESGSGPGSYDAKGVVSAHFNCCNPEIKSGGNGWGGELNLSSWRISTSADQELFCMLQC